MGTMVEVTVTLPVEVKVREAGRYHDKRGPAMALVFVDDIANRPGMKDIIGDFMWRRTVGAPLSEADVLALVKPLLNNHGLKPTRARWNIRAGCSCPCSPGYVVSGAEKFYGSKYAFFVTRAEGLAEAEMAKKAEVAA